MARTAYERLSGLDQAFLHFETANCYMHVALTAIFDGASLQTAEGGIDIKRIRRHIASRLPLIPRYRQRLHHVPLTNDAVWVDDDHFQLDYHVRHTHLPRPGGDRQLQTLVARILERPLDRGRPLWETWFIEGLQGGRFAMLSKVHHCMVDGIAGVDLLAALLGVAPFEQAGKAERWSARPAPSGRQMLRDDLTRRARASLSAVRHLPSALTNAPALRSSVGERASALWGLVRRGVSASAQTPFNQPIGPHRRIEWLRFDLDAVKAVKRALGGTVNDVVLATVSGAMREYLLAHRVDVAGLDFRTIVPVSVRAPDERGVPGNRVSVWMASLPIDEAHAVERHTRVRATTERFKESHEASGAEVLTQTAEWTTSLVLGLAIRLLNSAKAFNLVVTNVPGPPVPLYLLDAPMVAAYPHVPLFENQGLGIALFSYAESLYWGLVGDWDLMPDLHRLTAGIEHAFTELYDAAVATARPRVVRRRAQVA